MTGQNINWIYPGEYYRCLHVFMFIMLNCVYPKPNDLGHVFNYSVFRSSSDRDPNQNPLTTTTSLTFLTRKSWDFIESNISYPTSECQVLIVKCIRPGQFGNPHQLSPHCSLGQTIFHSSIITILFIISNIPSIIYILSIQNLNKQSFNHF
jgi:hypothetical protein